MDTSIVHVSDYADGSAPPIPFAAGLPAGAVLAMLRNSYASVGTATFETVGTVPPQLALAGDTIVRGAGAAVAGETYTVGVKLTVSGVAIRNPIGRTITGQMRFRAI